MTPKMKKVFTYSVLIFLISFYPSYAEDIPYNGQLLLKNDGLPVVFTNIPTFEEFPAEKTLSSNIATEIDWSSHRDAWHYRTKLRNGLKKGANYNGHYSIVTHGCGSNCQANWIIDVTNGKVIGNFGTTAGAKYRLDSRLIIAEAVENGAEWREQYGLVGFITYLKVENEKLKTVKKLDLRIMSKKE